MTTNRFREDNMELTDYVQAEKILHDLQLQRWKAEGPDAIWEFIVHAKSYIQRAMREFMAAE